jgi:hypothetical protein
MATSSQYAIFVVSKNTGFHIKKLWNNTIAENGKTDKIENWGMRPCIPTPAGWLNDVLYWTCGYIYHPDEGWDNEQNTKGKYWWCREKTWMPLWGDLTIQRATLMREIRAHWLDRWFSKDVPAVKKALLSATNLVPDVVDLIPSYLYPYQIKTPGYMCQAHY